MYKHILVPVDLNEEGFADKAVQQAVWLAKQSHAELHLLTVMPAVHMPMVASYFPKEAEEKMARDLNDHLCSFAAQNIDDDVVYHTYVRRGKVHTTIVEYAYKLGADLIVMPSHKRNAINRVVLGSVASQVVDHSPVHVMVVKPQG
ncbi:MULTISPECIES: universal stress protein [unclassified Vibrio]|uniref:Universal stress protein n=1 Tax=Vibrio sp. HB236076 TaxID=3232307 RepID=A0AB39HHG4_9VIBR|nr:universal stress protein [Vibrio sp. HB161653]MDP5254396.1 universal stress protein [Vibrio sp. HB161653]